MGNKTEGRTAKEKIDGEQSRRQNGKEENRWGKTKNRSRTVKEKIDGEQNRRQNSKPGNRWRENKEQKAEQQTRN